MSEVNFKILKNYHRENRHKFKESFSIRIHRSLSWIQRAEREKEDKDASFIFYWIAFNAAYSERKSIKMQKNERSNFSSFFHSLIECDVEKIIYNALWNEFANSIRVLLNNHYIYDPYWSFINGRVGKK